MVCTKCGARISEEDQFCPECGAKVIKKRRCPDCGALLRQDNQFCPKCGRPVGEKKSKKKVSQEDMDIPMEAIERNILSETAAEIRTDRRPEREAHRSAQEETTSSQRTASRKPSSGSSRAQNGSGSRSRQERSGAERNNEERSRSSQSEPVRRKKAEMPEQRRKAQPAPPPKKKRPVYREEMIDDEDWDDEDWDDDDDDEEGVDILSVMTAVVGCIVLVVVAFLGFNLYQRYVPKDYERAAQEQTEQEESGEESGEEQQEGEEQEVVSEIESGQEEASLGTLTIKGGVNIRDNPSTSGSNVIKVSQAGETYEYLEVTGDGEWYKIALSEDGYTEGYVYAEYVTVDE